MKHKIEIDDSEAFNEHFRCIPPPLLDEVRQHIDEMLEAGAIRLSNSPWCNAVVLVHKKDGGLCFCIDFRKLYAKTKKDSYPLPHIQETLDSLVRAKVFSMLDLKSGFWQIMMDEDSKQYTAFTIGNLGFFKCDRMPFGLCNAPATFQRLMQSCLGELDLTYCLIYLENVIIYAKNEEEHLDRLRTIFERFRRDNLKLKPSKCNLFQKEIMYLAHDVSTEGIKPSKAVLSFANYSKPFLLKTDASKDRLGAVLLQKGDDGKYHPIAYGSKALTKSEKNYHSSKLEFLDLKWAVTEHFREYLQYSPEPFLIRTDNNPLTYVMATPNLDATGHQWVGSLAN